MRGGLILGLTAMAALAACTPAEPTRDKAYWRAHDAERAAKLAECQNDPGGKGAAPNCVNAQAADADARTEHFYDVPKPPSRVTTPGAL
jgi:hypothetical protein